MDAYKGYHQFLFPTHSGYVIFEVYTRRGQWYWSEFDDWSSSHTGFENGPFESSRVAYMDAMGFSYDKSSESHTHVEQRSVA